MPPHRLDPTIRRNVARFRRRVLLLRLCSAVGLSAAVAATLFGSALLLDRYMLLTTPLRTMVSGLTLLVSAGTFVLCMTGVFRALSRLQLAKLIEKLVPELDEGLVSTLELAAASPAERARCSSNLLAALEGSTAQILDTASPARLLPWRPAVLRLFSGALICSVILGFALSAPQSFAQLARRFLHPSMDLARPSTVWLDLSPGSTTVATGSEVEVVITAKRGTPSACLLAWRFDGDPYTQEAPYDFKAGDFKVGNFNAGEFNARNAYNVVSRRFPPLKKALEYQVSAGDFISPWLRIDVREPPKAESFTITVEYPKYSRRPPATLRASGGSLRALDGSVATLEIQASEKLQRAALRVNERRQVSHERGEVVELPLRTVGSKTFIDRIMISSQASGFDLLLVGLDGVDNRWRSRHSIEALPDQSPRIELTQPRSAEISVEATSVVELEYRADDDVGLATVQLVLRPNSPDAVALTIYELPESQGTLSEEAPERIEAGYRLDIAQLGMAPGAGIPFVIQAVDLRGQESRTAKRELRATFLPHAPEGPGWLPRLAALDGQINTALGNWSKLSPFGREAASSLVADAATLELLTRTTSKTLAILTQLTRTADQITQLAQSIQIATPQRRTLELLARRIRTSVVRSGRDFWIALNAWLGKYRRGDSQLSPGTGQKSDHEKLVKLYRQTGSLLEETATGLHAILRLESIEDIAERSRTLIRDQHHLIATWTSLVEQAQIGELIVLRLRQGQLLREAGTIATELGALAERGRRTDSALEALSQHYRETCLPYIEGLLGKLDDAARNHTLDAEVGEDPRHSLTVDSRTVDSRTVALDWLVSDLEQVQNAASKSLDAIRARLETGDALGQALENLARQLEAFARNEVGFPAILFEVIGEEIGEELSIVQGMSYADLETVTELSSIGEIVSEFARELSPSRDATEEISTTRAAIAVRAGLLNQAYERTRPSRRIGLAIQLLESAASSEEGLTAKLRSAQSWKYRELQSQARAQKKISAALEHAQRTLVSLLVRDALPPRESEAIVEGLTRAASILEQAERHMKSVLARLSAADSRHDDSNHGELKSDVERSPTQEATVDDESFVLTAWEEARHATRLLDDTIHRLEALRREALTDAAQARSWLRIQRGTLAARIRRVSERETAHAQMVRAAGQHFEGAEQSAPRLFESHELLRAAVTELARQARRESKDLLESSDDREERRTHDRVAERLLAVAETDMLEASRALQAAESGTGEDPATLYADAALFEQTAADKLRNLAQALTLLNADHALSEAGEELEHLIEETTEQDDLADLTLEQILEQAKRFLQKCQEAATALAAKLGEEPRYLPVLNALRRATEHLQLAVNAAQSDDRAVAVSELKSGRDDMRDAARLARELRNDQAELANKAQEDLFPEEDATKDAQDSAATDSDALQALQKEVEAMIDKLLATRRLQREADKLFDEILGQKQPRPEQMEELAKKQEELLEEFDQNFMTANELVTLVAKLLAIEKEGRAMLDEERRLGMEILRPRPGPDNEGVPELSEAVKDQGSIADRGKRLRDDFAKAGFRLSAALPQVITAYWLTGDAAQVLTEKTAAALGDLEAARKSATKSAIGRPVPAPRRQALSTSLLAAAESIENFLARLDETRQQALQSIAEQESGVDQNSVGQRQLDASRAALAESLENLKDGNVPGAQMSHRKSMRSIAEATQALHQAASPDLLTSGEHSSALGANSPWTIRTRGDESELEVRFRPVTSIEDMPFPAAFREYVRIYLRALKEKEL